MSAPTLERYLRGDIKPDDEPVDPIDAVGTVVAKGNWLPKDLVELSWWESLYPAKKLEIIDSGSVPPLALAVEQEMTGIQCPQELLDELAGEAYEKLWENML